MVSEVAMNAKRMRYQNLLHVTLYYNKYSIKEFFKKVEEEGLLDDPEDLLKDPVYDTEFYRQLVKDAKEKIYPYRDWAAQAPDPVDVTVDEKKSKKEKSDDSLAWKISQAIYPFYDAPRRMMCGMAPFDIELPNIKDFKNPIDTVKEKVEERKAAKEHPEDDQPIEAEVLDKDGQPVADTEATEKVAEEPKQEEQKVEEAPKAKPVFEPVRGIANNDVQTHFNKIIGLIKDRVVKDTIINVSYNNTSGSFTGQVTHPDGTSNNFTVDAKTFLPDYYSILITDEKYGTLAVPFEHQISKDLVNTPMFKVDEETVDDILKSYYFDDIGLYYTFDFSSITGLNKMGKKKRKKFEQILTKLMDDLRDKDADDIPRFRFTKFTSVDDFQIASDQFCRSPLGHINETSTWIAGVTFDVKDGIAYQLVNDVVNEQRVA